MFYTRRDSIPGLLALYATALFFYIFINVSHSSLPTEIKEMSTNAVSRGGYEPTTVPIALGRGTYQQLPCMEFVFHYLYMLSSSM